MYETHYHNVLLQVVANEAKYTAADIKDINIDEDSPPQHVWDGLAPGTKHNRGQKVMRNMEQEDMNDNAKPSSNRSGLAKRFESAVNKDIR